MCVTLKETSKVLQKNRKANKRTKLHGHLQALVQLHTLLDDLVSNCPEPGNCRIRFDFASIKDQRLGSDSNRPDQRRRIRF